MTVFDISKNKIHVPIYGVYDSRIRLRLDVIFRKFKTQVFWTGLKVRIRSTLPQSGEPQDLHSSLCGVIMTVYYKYYISFLNRLYHHSHFIID